MSANCVLLLTDVVVCSRYDYENIDIDVACEMMEDLELLISDKSFVKQRFAVEDKIYQVEKADNFEYTDPTDNMITRNQVDVKFTVSRWLFTRYMLFTLTWLQVLKVFHVLCRVYG